MTAQDILGFGMLIALALALSIVLTCACNRIGSEERR